MGYPRRKVSGGTRKFNIIKANKVHTKKVFSLFFRIPSLSKDHTFFSLSESCGSPMRYLKYRLLCGRLYGEALIRWTGFKEAVVISICHLSAVQCVCGMRSPLIICSHTALLSVISRIYFFSSSISVGLSLVASVSSWCNEIEDIQEGRLNLDSSSAEVSWAIRMERNQRNLQDT